MRLSRPHSDTAPKQTWLILGAILLLAAGLRLTRLGLVEFKYDEATTARSALRIARDGEFPAVGMVSSEGPRNPALMSYVLAVPFAFSRDPRLAAGWVALLGVAAVGLTYWLGYTFFDWRVGAVAAVLFATSPWAVFQSRKIWAQNLPLFTILFVFSVLTLVTRRAPWALVPAMAAVGCLVSLHLGGLAFVLVLTVVAILFSENVQPGPLLIGLVLLLGILAPYVVHDARHDWSNLRSLWGLAPSSAGFNPQAFTMAARVASGYHLQDLAGAGHANFLATMPNLLWIDQVEIGLFWIGFVWLVWRVAREGLAQRAGLSTLGRARVVLLCWFLIPAALLTRRTPVQPHDFNLLYPVQHLVIALLIADVLDWVKPRLDRVSRTAARWFSVVPVLLVTGVVIWQIVFQQTLLTFVDKHPTPGGYGAPAKYALSAAGRASDLAAELDTPIVALLPGGDPRYDGPAAVFDVLLPPEERRLIDGREALVLPERGAVYLAHPRASAGVSRLTALAEELPSPLPLRGGTDETYRFFHGEPAHLKLEHEVHRGQRWVLPDENGQGAAVTLLGYAWEGTPQPGETLRWTTCWEVTGESQRSVSVHWFNHLVDAQGRRWGQRDGVGLPASKWRSGDVVLTWFDISISPDAPPPPYMIRTGMYTYPDIVNVSLVDGHGEPAGQFLELGPIDAH